MNTISNETKYKASQIKLLLMDVDGVLTDGTLSYVPAPDGTMAEFKGFNSHDGIGIMLCHEYGIQTGLISARTSPAVVERATILGMKYIYQGHLNKMASYEEILAKAGVSDSQTAFIGDDFPDAPQIKRAGLGVAVDNARPEIKSAADYVTSAAGGAGAVREVAELILKTQGHWPAILAKYGIEQSI